MEQEWNGLLDECKATCRPEPAPDASLGATLRRMVRERREKWRAAFDERPAARTCRARVSFAAR